MDVGRQINSRVKKSFLSFLLIKDKRVSEKWLSTPPPHSSKNTGESGGVSRTLVRLLAEKREHRSVEEAFQRWLRRSPDSREGLGQGGNSKECNFPRVYFVLSIVSTMNFPVKADYEDLTRGGAGGRIDIALGK